MAALCIVLIVATALCITWYSLSLRRKRKKAKEIVRWIQSCLVGRGQVVGIAWITPSRFRVPLRLTCGVFRRAWVLVELQSQQTPVQWFFSKIKGGREVLRFQADLDCPPNFSLQMQNFRWFARSSRKASIDRPGWQFEHLQPVMISTRPDSQKEIASTITSLSKGDNGDFLEVSFQRRSPHFSATLPLEALAPGAPSRTYVLDAMRELAGSASVF
jgi:type II secretory pathway pseudopilin PulG